MNALNPVRTVEHHFGDILQAHARDGESVDRHSVRRRGADLLEQGAPRRRRAAPLPARTVRRHAPAGRHRARALARAAADRVRRADHRARRHRAERGHGDDQGAAARAAVHRAADQPRPRASCSRPPTGCWSCTPARSSRTSRPTRCCAARTTRTPRRCSTATPIRGPTNVQLGGIGGSPPDLSRDLPGCPFAPRCSDVEDVCRQQRSAADPARPGRGGLPRTGARERGGRPCLMPRHQPRRRPVRCPRSSSTT